MSTETKKKEEGGNKISYMCSCDQYMAFPDQEILSWENW
jgi:hypothetical protein